MIYSRPLGLLLYPSYFHRFIISSHFVELNSISPLILDSELPHQEISVEFMMLSSSLEMLCQVP